MNKHGKLKSRRKFCEDNAIGLTTFHKLVKEQRLRVLKIGRKTVVAEEDEQAFRESLRNGAI